MAARQPATAPPLPGARVTARSPEARSAAARPRATEPKIATAKPAPESSRPSHDGRLESQRFALGHRNGACRRIWPHRIMASRIASGELLSSFDTSPPLYLRLLEVWRDARPSSIAP
jgi:hypothetical protein